MKWEASNERRPETPAVMTKERKIEMQDEITKQIAAYLAKGLEITKLESTQRGKSDVPEQDHKKRGF
jgi:hypothetical protein